MEQLPRQRNAFKPASAENVGELHKNLSQKGVQQLLVQEQRMNLPSNSLEDQSFLALKAVMATVPVLHLSDFKRQFVVMTNASDVAIGAILEQDLGSGLQPVVFFSRKLNATEICYSAYERELLGIVWGIGQWKHYFQGPHPIFIQTDHVPL